MKRILFVDDEPRVLEGLERMLYSVRKQWQMVFVSSGREALRLLSESEFDALITDLRMPEMSGTELLTQVVQSHPEVLRIVLSGTADRDITLRSAPLAHQYLAKPCDAKVLRATVERALSLKVILEDPALKRLVASIQALPSVPAIYVNLIESLKSPDSSASNIGAIIAKDPSMTAKVLQLVNSALFGIRRRIADPVEAVVYLGVETVRSLALTVSVFSQFDGRCNPGFSIEALRDHSVAVASLARQIAKSMALPKDAADDIFAGALMHDLGKLVLAANFPDRYREVTQQCDPRSRREAESRLFGANHCAVGTYLLWLWGLPESVTEIVACHHLDHTEEVTAGPVMAVYLADALIHGGEEMERARAHVEWMGLKNSFPDWLLLAEELRPENRQNVEADSVRRRRA
jgi:putative nucleotidyltransferase with HDIG domain